MLRVLNLSRKPALCFCLRSTTKFALCQRQPMQIRYSSTGTKDQTAQHNHQEKDQQRHQEKDQQHHQEKGQQHPGDIKINEMPPLLVRAALVGATVGIFTPVFATAGVAMVWWRVLPKSSLGNFIKVCTVAAIGGGVGVLCKDYIFPFLTHNSDMILPFAAANFLSSTAWFLALEAAFGPNAIKNGLDISKFISISVFQSAPASLPLGAMAIGGLTALTAPLMWTYLTKTLCDIEVQTMLSFMDLQTFYYDWLLFPVGLPVGIGAGFGLFYILRPVVYGTVGMPWTKLALPILLAVVGVSLVYFTAFRPTRLSKHDMYWVIRTDPEKGFSYSYNLLDGARVPGPQRAMAASEGLKQSPAFAALAFNSQSFWESEEKVNKKPLTVLPCASISLRDIARYQRLLETTDLLIQLKTLQIQSEKEPSSATIKASIGQVKQLGVISGLDVVKLLVDLECLVSLLTHLHLSHVEHSAGSQHLENMTLEQRAKFVVEGLGLLEQLRVTSKDYTPGLREMELVEQVKEVAQHLTDSTTTSKAGEAAVAELLKSSGVVVRTMSSALGENMSWMRIERQQQATLNPAVQHFQSQKQQEVWYGRALVGTGCLAVAAVVYVISAAGGK